MSPTSKTVVVTGATSGIGRAIVLELLSERHTVIGIGRRQERLDELTELSTNLPGEFHALSVDLRDQAQLLALAKDGKGNGAQGRRRLQKQRDIAAKSWMDGQLVRNRRCMEHQDSGVVPQR